MNVVGETLQSKGKPPPGFTGTWTTHHPKGEKYIQAEFVNGKLHGMHYEWTSEGQLRRHGMYYDGKMHGAWTYFDSNGDMKFIRIEEKGEMIRQIYYEKLKIVADGGYQNRKAWDGTFPAWHTGKVLYNEMRDGKPWEGDFSTRFLRNNSHETAPRYTFVRSRREKNKRPERVIFKAGKMVKQIPEVESEGLQSGEKARFDIGWPERTGVWLADEDVLRYAVEHLEDLDYEPNLPDDYLNPRYQDLRDVKYKLGALALRLARPRQASPVAWRYLVDSEVLKDGMSLKEAIGILGNPTDKEGDRISWRIEWQSRVSPPGLTARVRAGAQEGAPVRIKYDIDRYDRYGTEEKYMGHTRDKGPLALYADDRLSDWQFWER